MDELTRLALAARGGDPARIAALVRASYREVWTFCAHLVDAGVADDLAQDTYLRVFRALPGFRQDASARTWVLAIARRACADELRVRTRRRAREELGPDPGADLPARAEPDHTEVRDLLGLLEPQRRAAFALTQVLGLSYDETAEVCGIAPGTVRSRVARARSELLGHVGERDGAAGARAAGQTAPDTGPSGGATTGGGEP